MNEAVVRKEDSPLRELVVLAADGSVAGLLTLSDVVRAHARVVKGDARPAPPRGETLLSTRVGMLAADAEPVPASTPLSKLIELLIGADGGALPLEARDGAHAVVMLEHVRSVLSERAALDGIIVAADVARRVPHVDADDELQHALQVMDEQQVDALPVVESGEAQAGGVVTRAQIGHYLVEHYARVPAGPAIAVEPTRAS
jgi:CIC family chloride channel protein